MNVRRLIGIACLAAGFAAGASMVISRWAKAHADEPASKAAERSIEVRKWTDATGKYRTEAGFLELKDDKVHLLRVDGTEFSLVLSKLSKDDQAYVRAEVKRRNGELVATKSNTTAAKNTTTQNTRATALVAAGKGSSDWSQWRGPNRDGRSPETGLLQEWPANGPPLEWQIEGLGGGFSSVAVSKGKLFTTGQRNGKVVLIALREDNGKELWEAEIGRGDRPNSTPTVDGDLVFALSKEGDLIAAQTATGKVLWKKNYGRDFGGTITPTWGFSESLLVDGDHLLCTPGGSDAMIVALNKRNGATVWKSAAGNLGSKGSDGAGYASIVISNGGGVKQYIQLVGQGVIGVNAADGKFLWHYGAVANGTANIPTVLVKGDYVFCSSGYNTGSALLKLSKTDGGGVQAEEVYFLRPNVAQNHHGGMILLGDHVYMGHNHNEGFPLCLELMTGNEAWRPGRGEGKGSAAISYADGQFYFRYEDGTMVLIEATPTSYNVKGSFALPSKLDNSWPHPTISGGKLYLRDQGVLMCYDIRRKA